MDQNDIQRYTGTKFRPANADEADKIWSILQQAIARRRRDGSTQWQYGYPNPETVAADMANDAAYVLEVDSKIAAYAAVIFADDPAYGDIKGKWLTHTPYVVIHRVAVEDTFAGKGLANQLFAEAEKLAAHKGFQSVRVDTNFDNAAMLAILRKRHYVSCGEVLMHGQPRLAFEKIVR